MPSAHPEFPFQLVAVDFADIQGKNYLVYADRYTGWVEITLMQSGNAKTVCDTLRSWFSTYGAPEEISSDRGPPFECHEYYSFLMNWGIRKRMSSAYYAQSNGRAESAVKTAKRILADNTESGGRLNLDRACRALLSHRNTPVQDLNMSPAMMLYGRAIRHHPQPYGTNTKCAPNGRRSRNTGKRQWQGGICGTRYYTTNIAAQSRNSRLEIMSGSRTKLVTTHDDGQRLGGS